MIPQKQTPLAVVRDRRCVREHIDDGMPILTTDSHEQPGHERKVKRHVKLIAIPEVGTDIGGPLIGFRQKDASPIGFVDLLSYFLQIGVCLREVLTDGALALK